jgi:hypothetical protein
MISRKGKGKATAPEKLNPATSQANPATLCTDVTVQMAPDVGGVSRRDPSIIMRQVCAGLKVAKSPLVLLSGRWASFSNNFVFTFTGTIPFQDLLEISHHLTQPFPGSHLVPCSGWSRVTFNGVPAFDPETNEVYTSECLLEEVKRNLLCTNLHFVLHPRWVRPAERISSQHSSFLFAFLDPEGDVSHTMARTHLAMFRKAITFKKWHP